MKTLIFSISILFVISMTACKRDKDPVIPPTGITNLLAFGGAEGGYALLLHTNDGGKTWTRQGDANQLPQNGFIDGDMYDENTAILLAAPDQVGDSYFYRTIDRGSSWTKLLWTKENSGIVSGGKLHHRRKVKGVYTFGKQDALAVGDSGLVIHSSNQGDTWTPLTMPEELQYATLTHVTATTSDNNRSIHIGITSIDTNVVNQRNEIVYSSNSGKTWKIHNPLKDLNIPVTPQTEIKGIHLTGNSIWIVGTSDGSDGFIIRSGDNGVKWDNIGSNLKMALSTPINKVFAMSETSAYIVAENQPVYGTINSGNTWTSYPYTDDYKTNLQDLLVGGNEVFVSGIPTATNDGYLVYYSPDGGITWENRSPVLPIGIFKFPADYSSLDHIMHLTPNSKLYFPPLAKP